MKLIVSVKSKQLKIKEFSYSIIKLNYQTTLIATLQAVYDLPNVPNNNVYPQIIIIIIYPSYHQPYLRT